MAAEMRAGGADAHTGTASLTALAEEQERHPGECRRNGSVETGRHTAGFSGPKGWSSHPITSQQGLANQQRLS